MSLKEVELPNYKLRDELWNSITHGLGAIFGIFVLIFSLIKIVNIGYDINLNEKLLKEREEQEIRIAQFQNDIIKLRKKIKKLEEEKNNVK